MALSARSLGGGIEKDQAFDLIGRLEKQVDISKSPQGDLASWNDPTGNTDAVTLTAVVLQALILKNPNHPLAEAAARYLLAQGKGGNFGNTKSTRETLIALWQYANAPRKGKGPSIPVTLSLGDQKKNVEMMPYSFTSWLEEKRSVEDLKKAPSPYTVKLEKAAKIPGVLYYQSLLSSYFPMALVPRREDGLILSREFYSLDDLREEKPVTEFKLGENYKVTLTVLAPQRLPQLVVEHLLPAGLAPVDFGFSTTSPELKTALQEAERESPSLTPNEFNHEEIHDDRVMWYAGSLPAGIYKIRHVVRAATPGQFQAPGATAFPFYDSRFFARSRSMVVQVTSQEK